MFQFRKIVDCNDLRILLESAYNEHDSDTEGLVCVSAPLPPTTMNNFPPELLSRICQTVYNQSCPVYPSSLDPFPLATSNDSDSGSPKGLPSSYPPATWPEPISRKTLTSLCLVNKAFHDAAKPWLWLKIEVRLPQSWLSLLDAVVGLPEENFQHQLQGTSDGQQSMTRVIEQVKLPSLASTNGSTPLTSHEAIRRSVLASLEMDPPSLSIPPDLLSPAASREPSPRRLPIRAQSPGRWRLVRAISNALQAAMSSSLPGAYGKSVFRP